METQVYLRYVIILIWGHKCLFFVFFSRGILIGRREEILLGTELGTLAGALVMMMVLVC